MLSGDQIHSNNRESLNETNTSQRLQSPFSLELEESTPSYEKQTTGQEKDVDQDVGQKFTLHVTHLQVTTE